MPSSALRQALFRKVILPSAERLSGRSFLAVERELEAFQWLDPAEIRRRQDGRLAAIVRHAYRTVPYYHRLFDEAGVGREIGREATGTGGLDPEVFPRIPITNRLDLKREAPFGLLSRPGGLESGDGGQPTGSDTPAEVAALAARLNVVQTSGTTGNPVKLFQDPALYDYGVATAALFSSWTGLGPGDRLVNFQLAGNRSNWRIRVRDASNGRFFFPMEPVFARDGKAIADLLNRRRPDGIHGYASLIHLAAVALKEGGYRLDFAPKEVVYYSDTMDRPAQALVREVFRAPVYSRYGAVEYTAMVAQTCPEHVAAGGPADENLHLNTACHYVEVVGPDGRPVPPGTEGRLIITDLLNRVMPMIRYELGDTGSLAAQPCRCGRGLPLLATLGGRASEVLELPSGRRVPALNLMRELRAQSDLLWEYQVAQTAPDRMVVSVVPRDPAYGQEQKAALSGHLATFLGEPFTVEVAVVAAIPRERNGKRPILKTLAKP